MPLYTPAGKQIPTRSEFSEYIDSKDFDAKERARRQQGYDATVKEAKAAKRTEAAEPQEVARESSYGEQAFRQGPAQFVRGLAGIADYMGGGPSAQDYEQAGLRPVEAPSIAEAADRVLPERVEPEGLGQRVTRDVVAGAPYAAIPMLGAAQKGGTLAKVGIAGIKDLLMNLLQSGAGAGAAEAGAPPIVQAGASLAAGLAPSAAAAAYRGVGNKITGGGPLLSRKSNPVRGEMATRAAQKEYLGAIPESVRGSVDESGRYTEGLLDRRLGREVAAMDAGKPHTTTLQQSFDIAPATKRLAKQRVRFSDDDLNKTFSQRKANLDSHMTSARNAFGGGAEEDLMPAIKSQIQKLDAEIEDAFSGIRQSSREAYGIESRGILLRARDIKREATKYGTKLPAEIDSMLNEMYESQKSIGSGKGLSLAEAWSFRKTLNSHISKAATEAGSDELVTDLMKLKESVDNSILEAARAGGPGAQDMFRLRGAIETAAKKHKYFSPSYARVKNPLARVVQGDDPNKVLDAIIKSDDPEKWARHLDEALDNSPLAHAALRDLVMKKAFGVKLIDAMNLDPETGIVNLQVTTGQAEAAFRNQGLRKVFNYYHGNPKAADNAVAWVKRAERLMSTDVGTHQMWDRTGSALVNAEETLRVGQLMKKGRWLDAGKVLVSAAGLTLKDDEVKTLMYEALTNPRIGKAWLRPMKPVEWQTWRLDASKALARAARSTTAGAAAQQ